MYGGDYECEGESIRMKLLATINSTLNCDSQTGKLTGGRGDLTAADTNPPCACGHRESSHNEENAVGDAYPCRACERLRKSRTSAGCADFELHPVIMEQQRNAPPVEELTIERQTLAGAIFESESKILYDSAKKELVVQSNGIEFTRRPAHRRGAFIECWEIAEWLAKRPRFSRVGKGNVLKMMAKEIESTRMAVKELEKIEGITHLSKGRMKRRHA